MLHQRDSFRPFFIPFLLSLSPSFFFYFFFTFPACNPGPGLALPRMTSFLRFFESFFTALLWLISLRPTLSCFCLCPLCSFVSSIFNLEHEAAGWNRIEITKELRHTFFPSIISASLNRAVVDAYKSGLIFLQFKYLWNIFFQVVGYSFLPCTFYLFVAFL